MIRRYFFAGLVMMILGGLIYGYQKFKRFNTPVSPVLMAVPDGAAMVIETGDALDLWEKLTHTSIIWEDLKSHPFLNDIHLIGAAIDSVFQSDILLKNQFANRKSLIAVTPSGAERFSLLFAISTPPDWTDYKIEQTMQRFLPEGAETTEKDYDGVTLRTIQLNNLPVLHWARKSGLLLLSSQIIPVESSIRIIDTPTNLADRESFKKIGKTAGLYAHANVYINYDHWRDFAKTLLNNQAQQAPFFKYPLAGWSALDLTVRTNEIMLNGFLQVEDSSDQYFNVFAGQKGQDLNMAKILPANTAHLVYFGLSHFDTFYRKYQKLKQDQQAFFSYDQRREQLNQQIGANAEDYLLSWIDSEIGLFITEPTHSLSDQLSYLAISTRDIAQATENLIHFSTALGTEPTTSDIGKYQVTEMALNNAYSILLGAPFTGFDQVYMTSIGNYIVLASSRAALRNLISYYESGNTLIKDTHFRSLTDNLSRRSALLVYSGVSRAPDLYRPFLSAKGAQTLEAQLETVRNFDGFAYQLVESGDNLFYNNIFIRHNPVYTRESGAFWELTMATEITYGPQLVLNHYTQSREILVQDDDNNLHMISNTGQVLWSRKIEGEIMGRIQQIDLYKNNKLQLLFNTTQHLHLIDRNGNDVSGYPVKLSSDATAPLGLFDYDQNRDYRILIASESRHLTLFDGHGKTVKGWNSTPTEGIVRDKPHHLRLGNKDYIFAADSGGKIYLLNRQGKTRHRVKATVNAKSDNPFYFREGKNINNTELLYTDTLGNLVTLKFDNSENKVQLTDAASHYFIAADINNDQRQEVIIVSSDEVSIFDSEGSKVCVHAVSAYGSHPVIYTQGGQRRIGILNRDEDAVFLMENNCKLYSDFPLYATGNFAIGDINKDGIPEVVAVSEGNTISTYILE